MSNAIATRDTGPAVETEVVRDLLLRRASVAAPVLLIAGLIGWGPAGMASVAFAIVLVAANFVLAAALLSWTARISLALMMGAALFGYLLRLGIIAAAVLLVRDQAWVALLPLGLALIVTHLGLLLWETRHLSVSLAFPGLKPATR